MNKKLLLIAFSISGMAVLIYEIVWIRPLQLIFGSTIYAVSTMLTTFFVGFALGSYLFRNIADTSKNPALLFSFLEFGIGAYGLIFIPLLSILLPTYLYLQALPLFQFSQFFLSFVVLIIPATLMGAIWPVANRAYVKEEHLGQDVGKLYAFNSFGSFVGPIAAGFLLIPLLGITKTAIFAASLSFLAGVLVLIFVRVKK